MREREREREREGERERTRREYCYTLNELWLHGVKSKVGLWVQYELWLHNLKHYRPNVP